MAATFGVAGTSDIGSDWLGMCRCHSLGQRFVGSDMCRKDDGHWLDVLDVGVSEPRGRNRDRWCPALVPVRYCSVLMAAAAMPMGA